MLLNLEVNQKSFDDQPLIKDLRLKINAGEKVGLIGRNGCGKSTLINIIAGIDDDYDGDLQLSRGATVIATRQTHKNEDPDQIAREYIKSNLPDYARLKDIIDTYPEKMGSKGHMLQQYSDAVERFSALDYFDVDNQLDQLADQIDLGADRLDLTLGSLSGGQKRTIELIKVQRSHADLSLMDEPTNHLDYVSKARFIDWLMAEKGAALVCSHDRDVLAQVDRIIEIKDNVAQSHAGGYDDFLRSNLLKTSSGLNQHQVQQNRIAKLRRDVDRYRRLKEKAQVRDAGSLGQFTALLERAETELQQLLDQPKPEFWIDQDSAVDAAPKITQAYDKYKTRNINVKAEGEASSYSILIEAQDLSLGYDQPLFEGVSFELRGGQVVELRGPNGAGKTTIVKAIVAAAQMDNKLASGGSSDQATAEYFAGQINLGHSLKLGLYHQELAVQTGSLVDSVRRSLMNADLPHSDEQIRSLMHQYLFDPVRDFDQPISSLSGGQVARLQLIEMLAPQPNVLILDEPTNHLDLSSIEELESALDAYKGAIIYITHDSYFRQNLPAGQVVEI